MKELEKAVEEASYYRIPTSIIIFTTDNADGAITDLKIKDSGEDDDVCMYNLRGSQLRVEGEMNLEESSPQEDTEESSDADSVVLCSA